MFYAMLQNSVHLLVFYSCSDKDADGTSSIPESDTEKNRATVLENPTWKTSAVKVLQKHRVGKEEQLFDFFFFLNGA